MKIILIIIILLSFNIHNGHARPGTDQVKPEYEDESQEVLSQLSVEQLLERWERAVDKKDAVETKISRLIEEATIQGVSQELENRIIKARNQKVDFVRRVGDLESEIDSRQVSHWESTDSKEDIERNKILAKGMNDAFNTMRKNIGVPVMSYWNTSMPKSTAFSIDDMFHNPMIFRNIHYFLNGADVRQSLIAGVMITKTPPVDMMGSIGFKRVESSGEIFGATKGSGTKFNPPKYVLYLSPDASHEDLMRDYENVAEIIMLEQRDHMASAVEEAGISKVCDNLNSQVEDQENYVKDMNSLLDKIEEIQPKVILEEVLNTYKDSLSPEERAEFEKLNFNQATILNYANRALNRSMYVNDPSEVNAAQSKIQKLQNAIYQIQINQVPSNTEMIFIPEKNSEGWMNSTKGVYGIRINGINISLSDIAR